MAPSDSLMRLFQLRPFPLPFSDTHMLMPNPDNQILATKITIEQQYQVLLDKHEDPFKTIAKGGTKTIAHI